MTTQQKCILQTENLNKWFPAARTLNNRFRKRYIKALNNVSLQIFEGETLGIVGESGCGKTTFGRTVIRLEEPTSGSIFFNGKDITDYNHQEMLSIRREMQMIFQDTYASLDPRMRIGDSIAEPLDIQKTCTSSDERRETVLSLIKACGLQETDYEKYPHEFSGGQRQRIGIARALALKPQLLICDEPVSALDVSIQAQLINLMMDIQQEYHLTMIFISHDLSVISHVADRVAVMYLGKVVELATREEIFYNSLHPYTKALLESVPVIGQHGHLQMHMLDGELPSLIDLPQCCALYGRCPCSNECCKGPAPELREVTPGHFCSCHLV